ncbi:MAG TPA: ArsR family transcriptional regulator [Euryarchaeota archaeon]|nr:ArsR family transcriptional regulator [Euryarchaeota archaeon]
MDTLKRMKLILDEKTAFILKMTSEDPCTASEISKKLDIPHSVCYRKIKQLTDAELLDESEPEDPWKNRNQPKSYVSNVENAYVALERGEMVIVLKFRKSREPEVIRLSTGT